MKNSFLNKLLPLLAIIPALLLAQNNPVAPTGDGPYIKALKIAENYEVPVTPKPAWNELAQQPLFTVAWLSDLHITDSVTLHMVTKACNTIRDEIKPSFTLITGDNCGYYKPLPSIDDKLCLSEKRQLWFKHFIETEIGTHCEVLPGDNWPWRFNKVFGSMHRSFDACGFHFILSGMDLVSSEDPCCAMTEATMSWIDKDLQANSGKPTLFVMHETIWPPFMLDAMKLSNIMSAHPNLLAAMGGHLHLDLDFQRNNWRQLIAPAIGRSFRPAFKVMQFHPTAIILLTYEWDSKTDKFAQVSKWQKLDIPPKLQPQKSDFAITPVDALPPREKQVDNSLLKRAPEFANSLMGFIINFSVRRMLQ